MYCDNVDSRKDLFQDILLQLWKAFPTYNHKAKFTTWMYKVALNTAISQFRKVKNKKEDLNGDLPLNLPDNDCYEETEEKINILQKAISKLSKTEKSIIILYMDEYSYEEISQIIGISVSNVGVKINRIKYKLQTILKELGYGL